MSLLAAAKAKVNHLEQLYYILLFIVFIRLIRMYLMSSIQINLIPIVRYSITIEFYYLSLYIKQSLYQVRTCRVRKPANAGSRSRLVVRFDMDIPRC